MAPVKYMYVGVARTQCWACACVIFVNVSPLQQYNKQLLYLGADHYTVLWSDQVLATYCVMQIYVFDFILVST